MPGLDGGGYPIPGVGGTLARSGWWGLPIPGVGGTLARSGWLGGPHSWGLPQPRLDGGVTRSLGWGRGVPQPGLNGVGGTRGTPP